GCGASARGSPGQAERADDLVLEAPPVRGPDLLRGARRADGERRVADVPERLFVHGRWPRRGDEQDEAIAPAEGVDDLRELLRPEQARGADTPLEQQVEAEIRVHHRPGTGLSAAHDPVDLLGQALPEGHLDVEQLPEPRSLEIRL